MRTVNTWDVNIGTKNNSMLSCHIVNVSLCEPGNPLCSVSAGHLHGLPNEARLSRDNDLIVLRVVCLGQDDLHQTQCFVRSYLKSRHGSREVIVI